jgi:hypothetical protein
VNSKSLEVLAYQQAEIAKLVKSWATSPQAHAPRFRIQCEECGGYAVTHCEDYRVEERPVPDRQLEVWLACEQCPNKVQVI